MNKTPLQALFAKRFHKRTTHALRILHNQLPKFMSLRRCEARRALPRRAKKNPASRAFLSPVTLVSVAVVLAYAVSSRELAGLSAAYRSTGGRAVESDNQSLGDRHNRSEARPGLVNGTALETDVANTSESGSGGLRGRMARSQQRRKEARAKLHRRVVRRRQERAGEGERRVEEEEEEEEGEEEVGDDDGISRGARREEAETTRRMPAVETGGGAAAGKTAGKTDGKAADKTAGKTSDADGAGRTAAPVTTVEQGKKAADEAIPAGARTSGKVAEFRGSAAGVTDGMVRGQNVTRVSYTVYKIMKLFGFSSVTDSPAGAHSEWMGEMVRRLAYDVPSFRYVAVDRDEESVGKAKAAMGEVVDGEYFVMDVEKELPNATDVVFHWTELDGSERDARSRGYMGHIAKVMRTAKKREHGYIVFGQFPRLNGPSPAYRNGKWTFIGSEKEEPFLFNEHVRGVVPTAGGAKAYMMYLTFYSLRSIPMAALDAM